MQASNTRGPGKWSDCSVLNFSLVIFSPHESLPLHQIEKSCPLIEGISYLMGQHFLS